MLGTSQWELVEPTEDRAAAPGAVEAGQDRDWWAVHPFRGEMLSILKATVNFRLQSLFTWQIGECYVLV